MTHQSLTRFIATGLILISHSVFASEISQHGDTEAQVFLSNIQASSELLDNTDDEWQAAFTDATPKKSGTNRCYLTLSSTTNSITQSPKYNRYNPRAPPIVSL